ncbi:MAG: hypothetical protein QOF15_2168 [Mycobacterium sp.]|nr:hypothetical protein [Mycobacterium sp.]
MDPVEARRLRRGAYTVRRDIPYRATSLITAPSRTSSYTRYRGTVTGTAQILRQVRAGAKLAPRG